MLITDVLPNVNLQIRTHPDDVPVEGGMMEAAQREPIRDDGPPLGMRIGQDVGSIE